MNANLTPQQAANTIREALEMDHSLGQCGITVMAECETCAALAALDALVAALAAAEQRRRARPTDEGGPGRVLYEGYHAEQADTIRQAIDVLYCYTSDLANPPGEGRSWWRAEGHAGVKSLVAALAAAEQQRDALSADRTVAGYPTDFYWYEKAKSEEARADALAGRVETLETALNHADKWLDLNYGYLKPGQDQSLRELADAVRAALAGEEGADE